ncbi:MAG: hypothetical protein JW994_04700 [Candidatus Omnitrophica bacterium]|nr:hypothetical protein [Candidatus Omnitrophota bacterium]
MDDIIILLLMLFGTVAFPVLVSLFGYVTMDELAMRPTNAPKIYTNMIIRLIIVGFVSLGVLAMVLALFGGKK